MAYGTEQGFQNAGAPTIQPETEEERQRRLAQTQNFSQPQVQGPPVTGVHTVDGTWGNDSKYGVAHDVARYRDMANRDLGPGPQIDQTQGNEARGIQDGGIGMLGARARGATTPAQYMMGQQTRGAVAGIQSGAASIRGGAMARAAAQRGATSLGARVAAQGAQDRAALGAREQADAAGQLMGASTEQRGQDLGVATDQAKLEQQQRALAAQAKNNYEGLGYDVKSAALGQQLGRTAAQQNAASEDRKQSLVESKASWGVTKDVAGAGIGGVTGGLQAYNKTQQPEKPNPYDYAGSDPRLKTNVRDVTRSAVVSKTNIKSPKERLRSRTDTSGTNYEDGYDNSMFRKSEPDREPPPKSLTDAIEDRVGENPREIARTNPYGPSMHERIDAAKENRTGYAHSRRGEAGAMFGDQAAAHESPQEDPFAKPKRFNNKRDQDIAMSDVRTKKLPPKWLSDHMEGGELDEAEDLGDVDAPPTPKERLRARLEAKDLGDVDDPKFNPQPPKMRGPNNPPPPRADGVTDRHISPADQKGINAIARGTEAQRAMLGEPSTQRAIAKDSPLEEDREDRYAREAGRRDVAMSDPKAKAEAFKLGVAAGMGQGTMSGPRGKVGGSGGSTGASYDRPDKVAPPPAPLEAAKKKIEGGIDETAMRARDTAKAVSGEASRSEGPGIRMAPMLIGQRRPEVDALRMEEAQAMSDPRAKSSVRETPMASAMRSMEPSSYEYKPEYTPPEQEPGEENIGPMADKMKKNRIAKTAIVDTGGKDHMLAIDKTKAIKLALGGLSDLQRQIDQMKRRSA